MIVGLPEEDCRRKWRGLRDRYQRERRAEKEKKRSGSAASGQWPSRFCHILFLDPFIVYKCDHRLHRCSEILYVIHNMTTTCAAMEDDEIEEAPLDQGSGEIIMTLTEVTTEDLVEQDVAVETNGERQEEEQRHTRRHRRYQPPDPLNSFQQRLLQAVERDAAQPDAHKKEDKETLFAMSLVPTLERLPQQRKAAVKVKIHHLLFEAEFN
ncbi:unnamed protein product, partial [Coregonus sp. 'balchen']